MPVTRADIEERWNNRIIGHYDNDDGSGVLSYLSKYGKNISDEKLFAYADYARYIGKEEMAKGFEMNTRKGLFKCLGYHLPFGLKNDFQNMIYIDKHNKDRESFDLFECESQELSVFVVREYRERVLRKLKEIQSINRLCVVDYTDHRSNVFVFISDDKILEEIKLSFVYSVSDFYVINGKKNDCFLLNEFQYLFAQESE